MQESETRRCRHVGEKEQGGLGQGVQKKLVGDGESGGEKQGVEKGREEKRKTSRVTTINNWNILLEGRVSRKLREGGSVSAAVWASQPQQSEERNVSTSHRGLTPTAVVPGGPCL
ncbi:hypothetical protein Pmani_032212 [Petrolisthes manimaculis]|uniref:Uncharacterized protein n=1 Tax=Petrolisthes manimaculis TaxID=1843537 RepID=A0AAE1TR93_9EUCA|nr:hypothetical protein Pmani_032212 [Petrolisthes manimaculis]